MHFVFSVPYHEDQQLCEAWQLKIRYEEEIIQSPLELKQFFLSLFNHRSSLVEKLKLQSALLAALEASDTIKKEILTGSNFLIQSEIDNLNIVMSNSLHLAQNDVLKEQEGAGDDELLQYLIASEDLTNAIVIPNQDEDFDFGQQEDEDSEWSILTSDEDTESEAYDPEQGNQPSEASLVTQTVELQTENQSTESFVEIEIEICEEEEKQLDSIDTL